MSFAGTCLYNPNVVLVPQVPTVATQPLVRNIQHTAFPTSKSQPTHPTQRTAQPATIQQNGTSQPALATSAQSVSTSVQPSVINALSAMAGTSEQSITTSAAQSCLRNANSGNSPPRMSNASTQMVPSDLESRALERDMERGVGHRERVYPGQEVLDPGPPPQQVSVSVEARPSMAQLQQQPQVWCIQHVNCNIAGNIYHEWKVSSVSDLVELRNLLHRANPPRSLSKVSYIQCEGGTWGGLELTLQLLSANFMIKCRYISFEQLTSLNKFKLKRNQLMAFLI